MDNNRELKNHLKNSDIIVDALIGTGLTKPVSGLYQNIIKEINQAGKFVVSVDIPSGVDSDTGRLKIKPPLKVEICQF